ncbi:hypothetical protein GGR55DRAFT_94673 [Xylaria sp. FL0064]|nr:hypothetical protein GGR55DRAFT_94673 [Xylaria sp. FL0064]
MGKKDYSDDSLYISRPYHAVYISDDEEDDEGDDDVCVWPDLSGISELSDFSPEEPLEAHLRRMGFESKGKREQIEKYLKGVKNADRPDNAEKVKEVEETKGSQATPTDTVAKEAKAPKPTPAAAAAKKTEGSKTQPKTADIPSSDIDTETGKLTEKAFREREIQYALSTARRSLTHMSQFMLKLEARAGKATREGIRQTLDATVQDMHYDFSACDGDHLGEIEEIKHLSNDLYNRLYLIDRHWRRQAREARNAGEKPSDITILSEPDIREWIRTELKTNHLAAEETCFYTVRDLAANRGFNDWVDYLRNLCGFKDHPTDEAKLVELAWRFLDRNLRGPRPVNPTSTEQFVGELYGKWKSGVWDEVLRNQRKQELDDAEAWKLMRRYWSSRTAPS